MSQNIIEKYVKEYELNEREAEHLTKVHSACNEMLLAEKNMQEENQPLNYADLNPIQKEWLNTTDMFFELMAKAAEAKSKLLTACHSMARELGYSPM